MQRDLIKGDVGLLRRRGDADKPRWLLGLDERLLALRGIPVTWVERGSSGPGWLGVGVGCRWVQLPVKPGLGFREFEV